MRRTILALMGSTALAVASTTSVLAQAKDSQDARPNIQRDAVDKSSTSQKQAQSRQISDQSFVRQATLGNMFEVQSSRLASRKAQNQDVRDFAEQLIDDHQAAQNELKKAAGDISFPRQLDRRESRRLDRLRQTSNDRFDWRFIGTQIRAHRRAIALFEDFARSEQDPANQNTTARQNGETDRHQALVQWAQETLPTLREHLEMARQIRQDLREAGQGVARRQEDRQRARRMDSADAGRTLTIEQPAPRISVQSRRPEVTVQQPRPKITIRQAPPTITIEQPQPEIVVQMPRPDVNIEQRKPQVSVNMPEPQLEVDRAGDQADVRVRSADQPDSADQQNNVRFQSAQRPQVHYQRTGEPKVVYRRGQGEPTVRYQMADSGRQEQSDRRQQAGSSGDESRRSGARQTEPGQRSGATQKNNDWVNRARQLAGTDADDANRATTGKASAQPEPRTTMIEAGRLTDMDVYNRAGQNLGEVDQVIADQTGEKKYLVLAHGGFIGLFEDEVALPLERVLYRGDRLVVSGLTEQEIADMPNWEDRVQNSRELDDNQTVEVKLGQE
jgi:predicted outer membrane protein/sporulation protein YlmC with PRC-barrel domain